MFLYLFKVQYRGNSSSTAEAAWTGMGSVVASHRWEGPHYYACHQPGWSGHFQCSYQATPISGVQPALSVERPTRRQHSQRTVLHWSYWSQGDSVSESEIEYPVLHVQVTVHRDKLRIKQPTRCIKYPKLYFVIKLHMFRASSVPIIRSYLLYTRQLVRFMQVMGPLPSRVRLELCSNLTLTLKHVEFYDAIKFWIFDAPSWLFCMKMNMQSCAVQFSSHWCDPSCRYFVFCTQKQGKAMTSEHRY